MSSNCSYVSLGSFGSPQNNPLSYVAVGNAIESGFMHTLGGKGSFVDPDSPQSQFFSAQFCGNSDWKDGICEYMSKDPTYGAMVNAVAPCNNPLGDFGNGMGSALTKGQMLIRNAAAERFLMFMSNNCSKYYEPFDPTVADSPLISKWKPNGNASGMGINGAGCNSSQGCLGSNVCVPIYGVDEKTIDNDPIMNKILQQPWIAMDVLVNMYNNALNMNTLSKLKGTKLYSFFMNPSFQNIVKSKIFRVA